MIVHEIKFKVKGVTFKNEDGKDIQKGIKRILNEYKKNDYFGDLYGGHTNKEIKELDLNVSEYEGKYLPSKLVGDEYNGEECLKVYLKNFNDEYFHVGYAPKENLQEITDWITRKDLKCDGNIEIIGGKYKHCEIETNDEYEEIEKIVTEELTYGLEVNLHFYNDELDPEVKKEKKSMKKIEKEIKIGEVLPYIICFIIFIPFIIIFISFYNWLFK